MKHWTQELQDGKRLYEVEVNQISASKAVIERLEKWIKSEVENFNELEGNLSLLVLRLYSKDSVLN